MMNIIGKNIYSEINVRDIAIFIIFLLSILIRVYFIYFQNNRDNLQRMYPLDAIFRFSSFSHHSSR